MDIIKSNPSPIIYISGGAFGDFIQQLSIINEFFLISGRKGILYIVNIPGDNFRHGIENVFNDTYDMVSSQTYIKEYKIYNNEKFDINLSGWRNTPGMYTINWYTIFKTYYGVEWGCHNWINIPQHLTNTNCLQNSDYKIKDIIFINDTSRRPIVSIDFNKLYLKHGKKLMFISGNQQDYIDFKKRTGLDIDMYNSTKFVDLCNALYHCKMLIGGLSSLLAIAHSMNVRRIVAIDVKHPGNDETMNLRLDKTMSNIFYPDDINIDNII